jgi:hypothetical protein
MVSGGTTPRRTRDVLAAGVTGLMFKTGRCPGRIIRDRVETAASPAMSAMPLIVLQNSQNAAGLNFR